MTYPDDRTTETNERVGAVVREVTASLRANPAERNELTEMPEYRRVKEQLDALVAAAMSASTESDQ